MHKHPHHHETPLLEEATYTNIGDGVIRVEMKGKRAIVYLPDWVTKVVVPDRAMPAEGRELYLARQDGADLDITIGWDKQQIVNNKPGPHEEIFRGVKAVHLIQKDGLQEWVALNYTTEVNGIIVELIQPLVDEAVASASLAEDARIAAEAAADEAADVVAAELEKAISLKVQLVRTVAGQREYSVDVDGNPIDLPSDAFVVIGSSPFGGGVSPRVDVTSTAGGALQFLFDPNDDELFTVVTLPRFTNSEAQAILQGFANAVEAAGLTYADRDAAVVALPGLPTTAFKMSWVTSVGDVVSVSRKAGATVIPDMPGWLPVPPVRFAHFGAIGAVVGTPDADLPDDTVSVANAFKYASDARVDICGDGRQYGLFDTVMLYPNTNYSSNGTVFVKCFGSETDSRPALRNSTFNTGVETDNLNLHNLRMRNASFITRGYMLGLIDISNSTIRDLEIYKTSGDWCFILAGTDVTVDNPRITVNTAELWGDGLHITRGTRITVINPNIQSNSDDALAIHPHQVGWSVNGKLSGIEEIQIIGGSLTSPTASARIGAQESSGQPGVDWAFKNISFTGVYMPNGISLVDMRTPAAGVTTGVKFIDCDVSEDDVLISCINSGGQPRYADVTFVGCKFGDSDGTLGTAIYSTPLEKAFKTLTMERCEAKGRLILTASERIRVRDLDVLYEGDQNAVVFNAPHIDWVGGSVIGDGTQNSGVMLANFGDSIPFARVSNVGIENVARGIFANGKTVEYADLTETRFKDTSVYDVDSSNIKVERRTISASSPYSAGAITGGSTVTQTISVRGARLGSIASAAIATWASSTTVTARVTAFDTVVVSITNNSSNTLTPTGNIKVSVAMS